MHFQIFGRSKVRITYFELVIRLLSFMNCLDVSFQTPFVFKRSLTITTFMRLPSSFCFMNIFDMSIQMWSLSKVFIANFTWKRLFSIMNCCNMSNQNKLGCESFFTNGTFERFFTFTQWYFVMKLVKNIS